MLRFPPSAVGLVLAATLLAGCQTPRQKAVALVRDRVVKLQPLSRYRSTVCDVQAKPTEPALARFGQMFPGEVEKLKGDAWSFKWRQWESRCEIQPTGSAQGSPVIEAQRGFLEAAFCLLAQVFYVNSPFDELKYGPEDVVALKNQVRVGPDIFLDRGEFVVTTRTAKHGELSAKYRAVSGGWWPETLQSRPEQLVIVVDQIEYGALLGSHPMFKSFVISVGTEAALAHTNVKVSGCR